MENLKKIYYKKCKKIELYVMKYIERYLRKTTSISPECSMTIVYKRKELTNEKRENEKMEGYSNSIINGNDFCYAYVRTKSAS